MINNSLTTPIPDALNPNGYRSFTDFADQHLSLKPFAPAFTSLGATLSYRELDRYSRAFTHYLQNRTDLQPGDRIGIQLPNLLHYPIVVYGALRAGMVVVNTNPLYTEREMRQQFIDSNVKLLVVHQSMASKVQSIISDTEIKEVLITRLGDFQSTLKGALLNFAAKYVKRMEPSYTLNNANFLLDVLFDCVDKPIQPVELSHNDVAVLQYTGGTTGEPKAAILTQGNLLANILQAQERLSRIDSRWSDNILLPLPLYHIYAFMMSQVVVAASGHTTLVPNPRDLKSLVKLFKAANLTSFIGLNTLFVALCRLDSFKACNFDALKLTLSGGMALTEAAADRWQTLTGSVIIDAYGLSEASPGVATDLPEAPIGNTIGKPVLFTEVSIRNKEGAEVEKGQAGELWVRGPQVMAGYWNREDSTNETLTADRWLKTGDICFHDEQGYLHIVDRAKDLIIVSGFNVYPQEVEDQATKFEGVLEAAVVGVPDERTGEEVWIYVTADGAIKDDELLAFLRDRLAAYKLPRRILRRESLPKNPVGKVLRRVLRDEAVGIASSSSS